MHLISVYSQKVIFYVFCALFLFTPLLFYPLTHYFPIPFFLFNIDPLTYELFEFNKMYFVYICATIIATAWGILCFCEGKFLFKRTFMDYALILFFLSQFLSTIFSIDIHTSIWGYYSRFHGGLLSTISYLILYWAFVSFFSERAYIFLFARLLLFSTTLVALYGIAQRFGIDSEYWVQDVRTRVFSTFGQPNWLAAFLVAVFPVGFSFFLFTSRLLSKVWYMLASFAIFLALYFTGSRSGLLALGIVMLFYTAFFYIISFQHSHGTRILLSGKIRFFFALGIAFLLSILYVYGYYKYVSYALIFTFILFLLSFSLIVYLYSESRLLVCVLCVLLISVSLLSIRGDSFRLGNPGSSTSGVSASSEEASGVETGKIRFIVWKGAWDIFTHFPVLGSGVETFAYSFYQYRPIALLSTTEWDFLYNKAHNEYLHFLATTGAFGLAAYIFLILHVVFFAVVLLYKRDAVSSFLTTNLLCSVVHHFRSHHDGANAYAVSLLQVGLLTGFMSILITNFFGFSVVAVALLFFLYPAFLGGLLGHERMSFLTHFFRSYFSFFFFRCRFLVFRELGMMLVTVLGVFVLFTFTTYWYADTRFAAGRMFNRDGQLTSAYRAFLDALSLRKDEPFYYSELGWTQGNIVYSLLEKQNASAAADLVWHAEMNGIRAVAISPYNLLYWKKLADTYYNLSFYNYDAYVSHLLRVCDRIRTLAPTDVSTFLILSVYYERAGAVDTAYSLLLQASQWKQDLGSLWYRLGELAYILYKQTNDVRYKIESETFRDKALALEPNNPDFLLPYE